jgi:hypothetical protein
VTDPDQKFPGGSERFPERKSQEKLNCVILAPYLITIDVD